jgi:hypothetical protein
METHPGTLLPPPASLCFTVVWIRSDSRSESPSFPKTAPLCRIVRRRPDEAQLAVAALQALAGQGAVGGGQALSALCEVHGLSEVVGVLDIWLSARE